MFRVASVMAVLVLLLAPGARADVTVTAAPDTVRLTTGGGSRDVALLIANDQRSPLTDVEVAPFPAANVELHATAPEDGRVPAGATGTAELSVRATKAVLGETPVTVLVAYELDGKPQTRSVTFKVSPPMEVDVAKLAALDVKATFDDLRSDREQRVYFTVTNKTAEPLDVGEVSFAGPDFLKLSGTAARVVAPHQATRIAAELDAVKDVRPGKHQLLFSLPVSVGGGPRMTLTSGHEASVSVDGESALLTAAGIPSILLAPGLLLLGVIALLWDARLLRHPSDTRKLALDPKSGQFVVLSVTVSFLVISLWKLLGLADFYDSYGRDDVLTLWLVSLLAGILIYALPMGVVHRRLSRRTPKASDDPLTLLRKLGRQDLPLRLPLFEHDDTTGFMVQPYDEDRAFTWFAPGVTITRDGQESAATSDALRSALDAGDPDALVALLTSPDAQRHLRVDWAADSPQHPYRLKQDGLGENTGPDLFVQEI
jgi:hypothetical protein